MTQHEHDHDHSIEGETQGIALGFRIFEHEGEMYFAEAEISAYVDDPESLGATLVFHKVSGVDPTLSADDIEWPTWGLDVDDELERDESDSLSRQFEAILRQISRLSDDDVRRYLKQAMEETE
jgi:hypothetical protein